MVDDMGKKELRFDFPGVLAGVQLKHRKGKT